jgi:hypothetical protein
LATLVLDDGTETIRGICFDSVLTKIFSLNKENFIEQLKDINLFLQKKKELLAKEFYVFGIVKINRLFNNLEIVISEIEEVNPDELINELSKNVGLEEI